MSTQLCPTRGLAALHGKAVIFLTCTFEENSKLHMTCARCAAPHAARACRAGRWPGMGRAGRAPGPSNRGFKPWTPSCIRQPRPWSPRTCPSRPAATCHRALRARLGLLRRRRLFRRALSCPLWGCGSRRNAGVRLPQRCDGRHVRGVLGHAQRRAAREDRPPPARHRGEQPYVRAARIARRRRGQVLPSATANASSVSRGWSSSNFSLMCSVFPLHTFYLAYE